MNSINYNYLLDCFLDLGVAMLSCGAEISRVEDTVARMGKSYGAKYTNVFVITSTIMVTVTFDDGSRLTATRRIYNPAGTDFVKLDRLNNLSRICSENPLEPSELHKEIKKINSENISAVKYYAGSMIAAGGFAVFFGGTLLDGLMAALFAVLICFITDKSGKIGLNKVFCNFIASVITGLCIGLLGDFVPLFNTDKIIIGDIMLLVPGIAITNSVREMIVGDTISGIIRFIQSLLWAGALACGFMIAMYI